MNTLAGPPGCLMLPSLSDSEYLFSHHTNLRYPIHLTFPIEFIPNLNIHQPQIVTTVFPALTQIKQEAKRSFILKKDEAV